MTSSQISPDRVLDAAAAGGVPWQASMIAPDAEFAGAPLLRKEFTLESGHGDVAQAVLRATAYGLYEATINGTSVGPDVFTPGWSSYEWRLRYQTYDVTDLVTATTVLGASLGNGWYRGRLGSHGGSHFYGDELGLFAQLDVTFADGHVQTVATDDSWQSGPSSTTFNDIYDGQTIDARLESTEWTQPGYVAEGWLGTHHLSLDTMVTESAAPRVVRHESVRPVAILTSPSGQTLVDFGQNLVGWLRLSVQGPAGTAITIKHAEVLEHGELGTRPLRDAKATDTFVLSGGTDHFEPTKTFHGFRYVQVEGWPGTLEADSMEAVVVHSELERIGSFECSDPDLNQLHRNVVWGLRGNFLDVPTDCPQRNERLGWTGDIAVFSPTAAFLYDVQDFLGDWLLDLTAEQRAQDGVVPFVVPDILKFEEPHPKRGRVNSTAFWSDAAVWVPWALYEAYGDPSVLATQFDSMVAHLRHVEGLLSETGLWDTSFQFADWLDPDAPPEDPAAAKADKGVVATAAYYRSCRLVARCAEILGRTEDGAYVNDLADRARAAFNHHYVEPDGRIRSDCATVYALAVTFGLLDPPNVQRAGDRLAELVALNGYRVSTGFAGTPYVTWALSETGHLDAAYGLLLARDCPSWLYSVTMGATTIWERWDSMLPDGSINPGQMTSFNHYALGAVADWMHKVVGGINPAEPGYARVRIAPRPGGGLSFAKTSLRTPHGLVAVDWRIEGQTLRVAVDVPESVEADIDLPGAEIQVVGAGHHTFDVPFTQ